MITTYVICTFDQLSGLNCTSAEINVSRFRVVRIFLEAETASLGRRIDAAAVKGDGSTWGLVLYEEPSIFLNVRNFKT